MAVACGQTLEPAPGVDDAGTTDGSTTSDAPMADGQTADAPPGDTGVCTTISDDFNRASPQSADWTASTFNGTIKTFNGEGFVSQTDNSASVQSAHVATLARDLPFAPTSLKCTFKVRIDNTTANSDYVDVFSVIFTAQDGTSARVRLGLEAGRVSLREDFYPPEGGACLCRRNFKDLNTLIPTMQFLDANFETND